MAWLRKTADLVELVVNDPGSTKSGTCVECRSKAGRPVSEVGSPPFHSSCACKTETVQRETRPSAVIDEQFVGIDVPDQIGEPVDEGEVFLL